MWETALAFAIWGSYGTVLTAAHIDPVLTAIARSAGLGLLLTIASVAIARLRGPREITAAIPWRSGALWLSGAVLLVDEVLYSVSAVSGPVAIIGLAYGCVPMLAPLLSRLAGTDRGGTMRARHWVCLALAFAGNGVVFRGAADGADPFHDGGGVRVSRGTAVHADAGLLGAAAAGTGSAPGPCSKGKARWPRSWRCRCSRC